jgi:RAD51-like protein 1
VGPAGVGKTQFCHMLAILATLPKEKFGLDGSVLYFDSEGSFSADRKAFFIPFLSSNFISNPNKNFRLLEMATSRDPNYFNEEKLLLMTSRIIVQPVKTSIELMNK